MTSVAELIGSIALANEEAEQLLQLLAEAGTKAEAAQQALLAASQGSAHESLTTAIAAMGQVVEGIGECQGQIVLAIEEANTYSQGL
jgi:hypothetical protein